MNANQLTLLCSTPRATNTTNINSVPSQPACGTNINKMLAKDSQKIIFRSCGSLELGTALSAEPNLHVRGREARFALPTKSGCSGSFLSLFLMFWEGQLEVLQGAALDFDQRIDNLRLGGDLLNAVVGPLQFLLHHLGQPAMLILRNQLHEGCQQPDKCLSGRHWTSLLFGIDRVVVPASDIANQPSEVISSLIAPMRAVFLAGSTDGRVEVSDERYERPSSLGLPEAERLHELGRQFLTTDVDLREVTGKGQELLLDGLDGLLHPLGQIGDGSSNGGLVCFSYFTGFRHDITLQNAARYTPGGTVTAANGVPTPAQPCKSLKTGRLGHGRGGNGRVSAANTPRPVLLQAHLPINEPSLRRWWDEYRLELHLKRSISSLPVAGPSPESVLFPYGNLFKTEGDMMTTELNHAGERKAKSMIYYTEYPTDTFDAANDAQALLMTAAEVVWREHDQLASQDVVVLRAPLVAEDPTDNH